MTDLLNLTQNAAISLVVGIVLVPVCQAQDDPVLAEIAKAWLDRETNVRSAQVEWSSRHTETKGHYSTLMNSLPRGADRLASMGISRDAVVPPNDVTYVYDVRCSIAGDKLRYEHNDHQWSAKAQSYVPMPYLSVYDDNTATTLNSHGTTYTPWPDAVIHDVANHPDRGNLNLLPLLMYCRSGQSKLRPHEFETMTAGGRELLSDGTNCLVLRRDQGNSIQRFWVEMRDYTLIAYSLTVNEQPRTKLSVRYRNDPVQRRVLVGWTFSSFYPDGRLKFSTEAKVKRLDINIDLPSSEFELVFPPGTLVTDLKAKSDYVVKHDNTRREILKNERTASYDQWINSSPGEALGKDAGPRWMIPLLLCISAATAAVLVLRKWKLIRFKIMPKSIK